jgi:thioredoxin 1
MYRLISFLHRWCGPCKVLDPVISKYCEKNNVDLVKVDVDDGIEVAQEYSVSEANSGL